jgi:hypothetical protein
MCQRRRRAQGSSGRVYAAAYDEIPVECLFSLD